MQLFTMKPSDNRLYAALSAAFALLCLLLFPYVSAFLSVGKPKVVVVLRAEAADTYQLFYENGTNFNETQSVSVKVEPNKAFQQLSFELPSFGTINRVRLDIGTGPGRTVRIQDILFQYGSRQVSIISAFGQERLNGIGGFRRDGTMLELTTNSEDPFMVSENVTPAYIQAIQGESAGKLFTLRHAVALLASLLAGLGLYVALRLTCPEAPRMLRSGKMSAALIALFLGLIYAPAALQGIPKAAAAFFINENRPLAPKPALGLQNWEQYPKLYESYYNDHFSLRYFFMKGNNALKQRFLGVSPTAALTIGKDGWLYGNSEHATESYQGLVRFTDQELRLMTDHLTEWSEAMRRRNIDFLFVVLPDKHTIYPEYLPDTIRKVRSGTRTDQLLDFMQSQRVPVNVLDTRSLLLEHKADKQLFFKADSHWTRYASFLVYQEMMRTLAQRHPELKAKSLDDFSFKQQSLPDDYYYMDFASLLGMASSMRETYDDMVPKFPIRAADASFEAARFSIASQLVIKQTGDAALPNLLMFRDSYAQMLIPFLSEHFNKSYYVWDNRFHLELVEQERPDIVIYAVTERLLTDLLK